MTFASASVFIISVSVFVALLTLSETSKLYIVYMFKVYFCGWIPILNSFMISSFMLFCSK